MGVVVTKPAKAITVRGLDPGTKQRLRALAAEPFDETAAREFAAIASQRRLAGRRIEILDGQIAAITRANAMSLATRNTGHFEDCGIDLINPWEA